MLHKTSLYSTCISIALFFLLRVGYCNRSSFVQRRGTRFVLNGRPLYLNGFNAYWLMLLASDPSTRMKATTTFEEASKCGMNLARTWAFSDGVKYKPLQRSPGSYNEEMFKGLDFVVSEARKNGIYLILSLVNNWEDFGGKRQYVKWAQKRGHLHSEDDFFTNSVARKYFKNHIKAVLTRVNTFTGIAFKDDPTIFAWELMNEPRCQSDLSGRSLQYWIAEMAVHVKSIDNNHLLEVGLEGFYGESKPNRKEFNPGNQLVGTDFIWNNLIPQIDFATIHLYPDQWISGSDARARQEFVYRWFQSHIEDSISVLRKPFLLAEFGQSSRLSWYDMTTRESYFADIYETIYICARSGGPCGGAVFWQAMAREMENYGDGYEVVLEDSPTIARIITKQSRRLSFREANIKEPEHGNYYRN